MKNQEYPRRGPRVLLIFGVAVSLAVGMLTPVSAASAVDVASVSAGEVTSAHPRLLADDARFAALRSQVKSDAFSVKTYTAILASADALLTKPTLTYSSSDGVRILDTSREMVERAYNLGLAWQVTKDAKYAERLWKDLDAVTRFTDWNPNHFLDTAEMTHGVALAYDWLFSYWTADRRARLSGAIINLGLKPAEPVYDAPEGSNGPYTHGGNWAQNANNWNIVVNSGLAIGAIAVAQDDPALSSKILGAAITSIQRGIGAYANGGGYAEGLSYWDYATRYLVVLLQSLRSATGGDAGLSSLPGLDATGYFPIYLTSPSGERYNFGDSEKGVSRGPVLAGLGDLYGNASFTYAGIDEGRGGSSVQRLLWYQPGRPSTSPAASDLPLDRNFPNAAVASFRSSWTDPNATFVAFRTGSMPAASHQNLDAGSFNLDALGQNWATELGKDDYGLAGYFDEGAYGQRWDYYRMAAEGQNTLVINPYTSRPTSLADTPAARVESNLMSALSVADLSAQYPNDVTSWKRGIKLFDGRRQVIVQDEIRSSRPVEALWSMHTSASIQIAGDGRSATLTKNGKQVLARIVSQSASATFVDTAAAPLPSSPHPAKQNANDDVRKLAIAVSTKGNTTLAVQFTPLTSGLAAPSAAGIVALDNWRLDAQGTSRAEGLRVGGADISGFAATTFAYTVPWDPGAGVPAVAAYKTGATVTSTLPTSIPGVATTTITEPGKTPSTYRVLLERGPMKIKSAVATRTTEGSPGLTFDGDPTTYWTTWQDNSITYTLDQPRSIKSLQIDWRANRSRHTKFEVQTSWNGSTWVTRYDGAYDGSTGSQLIVPTSSALSKWVRIVGHGDQATDPKTSLSEIKLYSYAVTVPTATPSGSRLASVRISGVPSTMTKSQSAAIAFTATRADGRTIDPSSLSSVRYVSGNSAVAQVSASGVVTALAGGETSLGVMVTAGGVTETAYVPVKIDDPQRVRLYADADTWVRGGATSTSNYGADVQLAVKPANSGSTDESYTRLAYMGFDISALKGKEVASAILTTTAAVTEPSGERARIDAHAIDATWTESGLTFANRPALGATVGSTAVDTAFAARQTDISNYVAGKAAASAGRLSLGFTQDTPFLTGQPLITQIRSRESADPPYIDVVIKPEPATKLAPYLSSVELTGVGSTLSLDQTAQLVVTAKSTTGSTIDASALVVTYSSSDPTIVDAGASGVLTPKSVGTATISASVTTNGSTVVQKTDVGVTDPTKLRLYASGDAYVRGGDSADMNFASESKMPVKPPTGGSADQTYTRFTYMGFDLSALKGKKIVSATLSLNAAISDATGDRARLDIRAVEGAWSEAVLTFNNRPDMLAPIGSVEVDRNFDYRTLDVADRLRTLLGSDANSMSFGFTQDAPFLTPKPVIMQIRSRESTVPPYLDIVVER
ncbi:DNRLRE domain-containing protein [Microbacterium sp. KSW2-29]|uniref:DNRLRE domain-containing protein n=1 Tax=Microbacterium phycohabitans TaxID=3075993 RepID=A0ABU3SJ61_9MICO|nr:DNRLRE domain-containing protein [Microbacterium sp. KSW2-29]MDU0344764.1 DNRLRE domain-containing protein [Microbacterium sp. KSW2-29]